VTWVKICGITNLEDAHTAVNAGADALGFVFHESSPRNITPEAAGAITSQLPPSVEKVGVFAGHSGDELIDVARLAGLTAFQIYPVFEVRPSVQEQKAYGTGSFPHPAKIFVALPAARLVNGSLKAEFSWATNVPRSNGFYDTVFLDSGTGQQPGGTGQPFDWERAAPMVAELSKDVKVVIAGGLTPSNVADAIHTLKPWGVDVSSGVEKSPGKKDPGKVRAFVRAVRETDGGRV
jgi:phosphoribosylanthranilate isomerase